MENLQDIIAFASRYITVEIFIMVILVIGTFVVFSFFIQDLLQDYFKDYREKKKRDAKAGDPTGEKEKPKSKPKPKLRKQISKNRPRLVKKTAEQESRKGNKASGTKEKSRRKK